MQALPEPTVTEKRDFLSSRAAWPHAQEGVEVVETHMSWVFLVGERVYKLKKPVRTAFLDFSTLARRKQAVADELRLNRRLAPHVYLGAVALRLGRDGQLTLGPQGKIVDWLVEMRRLPESLSLKALIKKGLAEPAGLTAVADALAAFYRDQPTAATTPSAYADRFAKEHEVTKRALTDPGLAFDGEGLAEILRQFGALLATVRPMLEARVRAGRVVEGHGDLRPEHVFVTDPPVIIDCLEFNEGLRTVDPFDELTFLGLECAQLGADWVFPHLLERVEADLGDRPAPELMAFYWSYRALLRARLALLHLDEPRPREPGKWRPLARRYVGLAAEAEIRCCLR